MRKFALAFAALMLFFAGCSKEDGSSGNEPDNPQTPTPTAPKIEIAEADKTINFSKEAGERSISFSASDSWTATPINDRADGWLTVSPASGAAGFASIKLTVTENTTPDERSASVQIKSGSATVTIVVTQKQQNALTVTQSRFDVGAAGGSITVVVAANVNVECSVASAASSWIHPSQDTRAMTTSQFKFTIDPNTTSNKREGAITVYGNGLSETIMVYQAKGDGSNDDDDDDNKGGNGDNNGDDDNKGGNNGDDDNNGGNGGNGGTDPDDPNGGGDNPDDPNNPGGGDDPDDPNDPNNPGGGDNPNQPETPSIVVSTNNVTLTSAAQSFAVEVSHNVDVAYEISASWLTHADTRAMSTNTYYFNATENDDVTERTATITFKDNANGISEIISVSQKGVMNLGLTFKDPLFLQYLLSWYDKDFDGQISQDEANLVKHININNKYTSNDEKITSLSGIEYFTNLQELCCDYNLLTELDISQNTELRKLSCGSNQLISLDVSKNIKLTDLYFRYNPLELLNLGDMNITSLLRINYDRWITSTKLKIISSKLTELDVRAHNLKSLDVSECPALTALGCDANPLELLNIGNVNISKYITSSSSSYTYSKDLFFKELSHTASLKVIGSKISQINIYTEFLTLSELQSLDVSECPALTKLVCNNNHLTNLDVRGCKELTHLECSNNQLKSLDCSECTKLTYLKASQNQLTSLDVSGSPTFTALNCDNNPLELLNLGDADISLIILSNLGESTKLKVVGSKLESLNVSGNKLQMLDLSECPVLNNLSCGSNQLTDLNLVGCYALETLTCGSNQLISLNLTDCCSLHRLHCESNQLRTLDLSKTNMDKGWLVCAPMETLQTLILKSGWELSPYSSPSQIPSQTEIVFVD